MKEELEQMLQHIQRNPSMANIQYIEKLAKTALLNIREQNDEDYLVDQIVIQKSINSEQSEQIKELRESIAYFLMVQEDPSKFSTALSRLVKALNQQER